MVGVTAGFVGVTTGVVSLEQVQKMIQQSVDKSTFFISIKVYF
jgi:alpha-D-ribose 1-methylphosphonate 5-phosphate C-P lyase